MSACDLHLHSHYSDGTWSPTELIIHAIKLGLSTVSLTDHDSVSGLSEARIAGGSSINLISGVELSCKFENRSTEKDFHLLGYFVETDSPKLKGVLEYNKLVRLNFAKLLVKELNTRSIPLTLESILEISGKGTIGASHMTKAILASGVSGDITSIYNRFFGKNKEIQLDRLWISISEAIDAIRSAGGVSVLAHPGFSEFTSDLILELKELGLNGVEVFHSYHSPAEINSLIDLAKQLNLVITGGSDCHGPYGESAPYMGALNLDKNLFEDFLALGKN